MKLIDLEAVLPTTDNIVIEFVPPCGSSKLRAREAGDGAEIEAVDGEAANVDYNGNYSSSCKGESTTRLAISHVELHTQYFLSLMSAQDQNGGQDKSTPQLIEGV